MRLSIPFVCALALCLPARSGGQAPVRDFQYAVEANPLLSFRNAAGLSEIGNEGFSVASASFTKGNGALVPIEGSPDSWDASAYTESYRRISDRIAFSGRMSYSQFMGQKMGGEVLLHPSDNAINFLEETPASAGTKKRETYNLYGAVSYSFSDKLTAGLRLDYTAADQAKFKDPRFLNSFMDISTEPGIMLSLRSNMKLGANLIYRHTLEQLSGGLFGTVDTDYDILVDQGAFLGSKEEFDGDHGYVSTQNTRPLSEDRYGLAVQLATGYRSRFYGQLTGLWRTGYYGSKTSTSVVFCEFKGPEAEFEGVLDLPSGRNKHRIELDGKFKMLSNYTNSYEYKPTSGMNTVVEYHGQNRTQTRNDIGGRLAYSFEKNRTGYLPDWVFNVEADALMQSRHTVIYPDYRNQSVMKITAVLGAIRNIKHGTNCFSIKAGAGFSTGSGYSKSDGSYGGTSKARSFDDWLNRQFEYDTASRISASVELGWAILRFKRVVPFIKVSDSFVTLLSAPQYLDGRTRNVASIAIGCNF